MSPPWVESSSTPRVAIMCWIGTPTETIVSPRWLMRTRDCVLPSSAPATSGMVWPLVAHGSSARGVVEV